MAKPICPSEHIEQCTVVQWLDWNNIKFFAVPNANNMSSSNKRYAINVANRMKKEGVRSGVYDLVILDYKRVLFLEMKRLKGSRTSLDQIDWGLTFTELGHDNIICKGADEAIEVIKGWLANAEA